MKSSVGFIKKATDTRIIFLESENTYGNFPHNMSNANLLENVVFKNVFRKNHFYQQLQEKNGNCLLNLVIGLVSPVSFL